MAYQPAENLTNRTFVGLIVAQFLAGFNDQAIHAAAMFYAMHTKILSQSNAITLMPILFYAPWAIFCTLAGYYADRYSKTLTLRVWKISEVAISLLLIVGFYFGSVAGDPKLGGWIVMSCVFMMGTHAAFFAPAKYGAMPEILRPHMLSRGNGILEMTTFLASIFGTVAGGFLFERFRHNEIWIGVILLVLSIIGTIASFMIAWLPPASPERQFPVNLVKPLIENLKVMFRSRPLALAMFGIAFFIFMVAYMRASMYMHGETRNPRWDEETTSLIVATVALGVGLGSPWAGYLSGGKIELGLVPLGCLGMIFALVLSALFIEITWVLVVALILIGFFSGFYMVPLYTLLQHRAPKKSKGELVATSNFINVTGAIAASILFKLLVLFSALAGMTPEVKVTDHVAEGVIKTLTLDKHGKIRRVAIQLDIDEHMRDLEKELNEEIEEQQVIDADESLLDALSGGLQEGDQVIVAKYELRNRVHFLIRRADQTETPKVYDTGNLPRFLFLGAALMTLGILIMLCRKLPDFFVRMLFWMRSLGKYRIKAVGMQHLPTEGPVILGTNCKNMNDCLQLVSATDRSTKVVLIDNGDVTQDGPLLRSLARRYSLIVVRTGDGDVSWQRAKQEALRTLQDGHLLAISLDHDEFRDRVAEMVHQLHVETNAPLLPVYCGSLDSATGVTPRIRIVFGEMIASTLPPVEPTAIQAGTPTHAATQESAAPIEELQALAECKQAIIDLGKWIRENDDSAGAAH